MEKPRDRLGYDQTRTSKCIQVLLTIIRRSAGWKDKLILVGGLVPSLLFDDHVGTTDIDVVLNTLDLKDEQQYKTLEQNLKQAGLERGTNSEGMTQSFRWVLKDEKGAEVASLDLLCPSNDEEGGRIIALRGVGERKLSAFGIPGARLVINDFIEVPLTGELLNNQGITKVDLRVAGPTSYLVMKALAFKDRGEEKDSYDLVYFLRKYGPQKLGSEFANKMNEHPEEGLYDKALSILEQHFLDDENHRGFDKDGPVAYSNFEHPTDTEEQEVARQDAVSLVQEFMSFARKEKGPQESR